MSNDLKWVRCKDRMPEIDTIVATHRGPAIWRGGHWDHADNPWAIELSIYEWRPLSAADIALWKATPTPDPTK